MQKAPRILTLIFLSIFLLQMIGLVFLLFQADPAGAQSIELNTPLPNMPGTDINDQGRTVLTVGPNTIGNYVMTIYKIAVNVVGILSVVVMMFGGVLWIMSGGNAGKVDNAKSWIAAAATGLVLTLASYMLLNTINPDLVRFSSIDPQEPELNPQGCCLSGEGGAFTTTRSNCEGTFNPNLVPNNNNTQCIPGAPESGCCICYNTGIAHECIDGENMTSLEQCQEECRTIFSITWNGHFTRNHECLGNQFTCVPISN